MGITGTTAKEAGTTIKGSVDSMKSAWENLLTGLVDGNADIGSLIDNLVVSIVGDGTENNLGVLGNVLPAVQNALTGVGKLIEGAVPVIINQVPALINSTLPSLLQSGLNMVLGVVQGITQNLPTLVSTGVEMLLMVIDGLIEAIPQLIDALPEVITAIVVTLGDNAPKIMQSGVKLITALIEGLVRSIPTILNNLPQIIIAIVKGLMSGVGAIADVGVQIVKGLWEGIKSMASWLGDKVSGFFGNIVDGAKEFLGIHSPSRVFAGIGKYMAEGLGEGWDDNYARIRDDIESGLNFDATANVTASGANSPRNAISPITITVNINGGATADTGNEIGRRIANELRYRGVLNYA
jgi:phage-related protein